MRDSMVQLGRQLVEWGLSPGTSGNLSVRDGDHVIMSPTGTSLGELRRDQLSVLDLDGKRLDGPPPSKEYPFHRALYRRSAESRAIVHLHSSNASAQACLPAWSDRSAVPPLTPYLVMRVGQVPLIPYAAPGSSEQATIIEELPFRFTSALLQNHGLITSGASLEDAVSRAVEVEECCKLLSLIGQRESRHLTAAQVDELVDRYGAPWDTAPGHGWPTVPAV